VIGPDVETHDDRTRRAGKQNVALRDRADAAMDDVHRDLVVRELPERIGKRFCRTALVSLDDNAQRALLSRRSLGHEVFEGDDALGGTAALGLTVEPLPSLSNLARLHRVFD